MQVEIIDGDPSVIRVLIAAIMVQAVEDYKALVAAGWIVGGKVRSNIHPRAKVCQMFAHDARDLVAFTSGPFFDALCDMFGTPINPEAARQALNCPTTGKSKRYRRPKQ